MNRIDTIRSKYSKVYYYWLLPNSDCGTSIFNQMSDQNINMYILLKCYNNNGNNNVVIFLANQK